MYLLIADALVYAENLDVDTVIDLATLTGKSVSMCLYIYNLIYTSMYLF
jgi:leucyl aminopeptidase